MTKVRINLITITKSVTAGRLQRAVFSEKGRREQISIKKFVLDTATIVVIRELTNRRLSHDGAVGSPYVPASSSCRNLNLRITVKTTTFMRD